MTGSHRAEEISKARIAVVGALSAGALLLAPLGVALATPAVAYALPPGDGPSDAGGSNINVVPGTIKIDPPTVVPGTITFGSPTVVPGKITFGSPTVVPGKITFGSPTVVPGTMKFAPPKVVPFTVKIPHIAVAPTS